MTQSLKFLPREHEYLDPQYTPETWAQQWASVYPVLGQKAGTGRSLELGQSGSSIGRRWSQ